MEFPIGSKVRSRPDDHFWGIGVVVDDAIKDHPNYRLVYWANSELDEDKAVIFSVNTLSPANNHIVFNKDTLIGSMRATRPVLSGNDQHSRDAFAYRVLQWQDDVNRLASLLKDFGFENYDADVFRSLCEEGQLQG